GSMTRLSFRFLVAFAVLFIAPATFAAAFTPGNIVVYRINATSSNATAIFLDEYTPAGALVQSIPMPTSASLPNRALTGSGSATTEGLMTRSADNRYLILS